jgi:hypothetical protein
MVRRQLVPQQPAMLFSANFVHFLKLLNVVAVAA